MDKDSAMAHLHKTGAADNKDVKDFTYDAVYDAGFGCCIQCRLVSRSCHRGRWFFKGIFIKSQVTELE